MHKAGNIKQWLWNIISSGLPVDHDLEPLRKVVLINSIIFIGSFVLILLGTIEFIVQDYFLSAVNLTVFLFLSLLFFYLRTTRNYELVSVTGVAVAGFFYLFLIAYGGMGNSAYVWLFTYPLITIFLLGARKGTVFSLILLALACTVFALETTIKFLASYDIYLKIRFVAAYLTVFLFAFIMEKTREIVNSRLETAKSEIEKTVEKLEKTNDAVTLNEKRLRQIIDLVPHFIFAKDSHGRFILANQAVAEAYGTTVQELIRKCDADFSATKEQVRHFRKDDDEVIRSGVRKTIKEEQITDAAGKTRVLSTQKIPFTFSAATLPAVLGVSIDITERKKAEDQLREKDAFQNLLMTMATRMVTIPLEKVDEQINNLLREIGIFSGLDRVYIFTNDYERKISINTHEWCAEGITSEIENMQAIPLDEQTDILETHQRGEPFIVPRVSDLPENNSIRMIAEPQGIRSLLLIPLISDGEYFGYVGFDAVRKEVNFTETELNLLTVFAGLIVNVEMRRKMDAEKVKLQTQLTQAHKMESIGLLAGGVAHDLNNVLSGIVSYPELILMNLPEDSKLRKPLKAMMESGLQAAAIVQDLLTLARGVATANEPLNLNNLIREYLSSPECDMLKQHHRAITIKTGLDSSLLNIGGSPVHVRKVIMNVVSNAAEAIKESGNITISTANRYIDKPLQGCHEIKQGEYAVLRVYDDGHGISPDDLERIFEPFYTKKKLGRSGTGLGLAVVWNVMQDHKGYIDVTTGENGTIFELYFPHHQGCRIKKGSPLIRRCL
jgi:PAS domain S-box-containing protein